MIAAIVHPRARCIRLPAGTQRHGTEAPGHAVHLAREIACDLLIVAGGDGLLNEVVNGLVQRPDPPPIALIPRGTGNDFHRTLRRSRATSIDIYRARYLDHDGRPAERCFVNAAGIGLAALAARRAASLATSARYLAAAVPILAARTTFPITLQYDDAPPLSFDITTAAVANGQFQGGGIRIAPEAALDDRLADITIVQPVSLFEVVSHLPILYNGRLYHHPQVRHYRASRISITSSVPVPLELDGEPVGTLPLQIARLTNLQFFPRSSTASLLRLPRRR